MRAVLLAVLGSAVLASAAGAQTREVRHDGFWVGFGLGLGANLTEGYESARLGGSGYVRLGGTVTPRLLIGGEAIAWVREQAGTTVSQGNVTATLLFYPAGRGVHLKGGLGFASWSAQRSAGPNTTATTTVGGFGATAGLGYDLQIGSNLFLTPNVDFLLQAVDSESFQASTGYLVLFTLGLTWH
jgi:hypothetical protein